MVEAREHCDFLPLRDVEQRIGETTQDRLPHVPVNVRMGCRESNDASSRGIYGTRKLGTQPGGSALVPTPRLKDVEASLGAEAEAHGEGSALEKFLAEDLPGDGRRGIITMRFEASVELRALSVGDLKHLVRFSHAVPEVLSQLNALGHGQAAEVRSSFGHAESWTDKPYLVNPAPVVWTHRPAEANKGSPIRFPGAARAHRADHDGTLRSYPDSHPVPHPSS